MSGWLRTRTRRGGIFGFPRWLGVPLCALLVVTRAPAQTTPERSVRYGLCGAQH